VTFHGWSAVVEQKMRGARLWLFRLAFSRAEKFVVLAEDFKSALRQMGFTQEILVESTFVDDTVFHDVKEASLPLMNGHPKPFSMLFLSRILRQKGIFVVLESYRILKPKYKSLRLIVAGDGDDLTEARAFVEQHSLEGVEFAGFVEGEEKKAIFLRADAFVLPTYYGEGMPIAMLEAMICGLPVISRPVGGIKDFFEQDRMGVLIDDLEPTHYANAIERLMLDRPHWNEVRLHNHRYARGKFLASSAADRLMKTYSMMVNEMGRRVE
jgi:glycosyltransferase involved in cell wall biosynthesis